MDLKGWRLPQELKGRMNLNSRTVPPFRAKLKRFCFSAFVKGTMAEVSPVIEGRKSTSTEDVSVVESLPANLKVVPGKALWIALHSGNILSVAKLALPPRAALKPPIFNPAAEACAGNHCASTMVQSRHIILNRDPNDISISPVWSAAGRSRLDNQNARSHAHQ